VPHRNGNLAPDHLPPQRHNRKIAGDGQQMDAEMI
jgi:hypothetical protein